MIVNKIQDRDSMYPIIYEFFSEDPSLIKEYHNAAGTSIETCVEDTLNSAKNDKSQFFVIKNDNNEPIAYFSRTTLYNLPYMDNFFIKVNQRNKQIKQKILNIVYNEFNNDEFLTAIDIKNTRAIKFYSKLTKFVYIFPYKNTYAYMFIFNRGD